MGYTVYFKTLTAFPAGKVHDFLAAVNAALAHSAMPPVFFEYDQPERKPRVSTKAIRLNGLQDDGHETFFLDLSLAGRGFCKTNQKPYTAAVLSVLKLTDFYAPGWCQWDDDGRTPDHDLANTIVQDVLEHLSSAPALSGPLSW